MEDKLDKLGQGQSRSFSKGHGRPLQVSSPCSHQVPRRYDEMPTPTTATSTFAAQMTGSSQRSQSRPQSQSQLLGDNLGIWWGHDGMTQNVVGITATKHRHSACRRVQQAWAWTTGASRKTVKSQAAAPKEIMHENERNERNERNGSAPRALVLLHPDGLILWEILIHAETESLT